jgi:NTP pyrophosphatase (non-canonical NTP hydrolase)
MGNLEYFQAMNSVDYEKDFKEHFERSIKDTFEDEIADVFIRLGDMCGGLNIDIEKHIEAKMKYNKTREKLHGKKY